MYIKFRQLVWGEKKHLQDAHNKTELLFFAIEDEDIGDSNWLTDASLAEDLRHDHNEKDEEEDKVAQLSEKMIDIERYIKKQFKASTEKQPGDQFKRRESIKD